jgi:hypothetical protein
MTSVGSEFSMAQLSMALGDEEGGEKGDESE